MQKLGTGQDGRKTELLVSGTSGFLWASGCLSKGINLQRPQAGSSEVSSGLHVQRLPPHSSGPVLQNTTVISSLPHWCSAAPCLSLTGLQVCIRVSLLHHNMGAEMAEPVGSVSDCPGSAFSMEPCPRSIFSKVSLKLSFRGSILTS